MTMRDETQGGARSPGQLRRPVNPSPRPISTEGASDARGTLGKAFLIFPDWERDFLSRGGGRAR